MSYVKPVISATWVRFNGREFVADPTEADCSVLESETAQSYIVRWGRGDLKRVLPKWTMKGVIGRVRTEWRTPVFRHTSESFYVRFKLETPCPYKPLPDTTDKAVLKRAMREQWKLQEVAQLSQWNEIIRELGS